MERISVASALTPLEGLLVYGTRVAGPHVVSGALAYP